MAKVLVTGASGFVGKRLIITLLSQGHEVYALCRIKGIKLFPEDKSSLKYLFGDLRNPETYREIPEDIDAAYYLVHSMAELVDNLPQAEARVAEEFLEGIKGTKVRQVIYLGGIINDEQNLSPHLKSRLLVEEALKKGPIPVTVLRASIIIGAGSASFEIIRDLCEKLPVMVAPRWVMTKCQPISIIDVLFYLSHVLLNEKCYNKTFDIGGEEIYTFKELMLAYSEFRHLKRWIIDVPVLTPRLSSYWLVFITSVRLSLCSYLVESMKNSSEVKLKGIETLLPHRCLTYREALEAAFEKISKHEVVSTWMENWELPGIDPDIANYAHVPVEGCLSYQSQAAIQDSKEATLQRVWSIGGDVGYPYQWAWALRGLADQMIGGVGLNRGRRHPTEIQVGDSIDFWRVLHADKNKGSLILFATMKVPGEAWLQFEIKGDKLVQTATFRPQGVLGRLYWYSMYPMHFLIFNNMAKTLAGNK